ncbi:MAG: CGNR zinc finger domain-containing protein [Actinomycetota bacterium]
MNFDTYTSLSVVTAVNLVNTLDYISGTDGLTEPEHLAQFLQAHRDSYRRPVTAEDVADVRALRDRLRTAFVRDDEPAVVALLNALLAEASALPQLSDHDGEPWHLHFTPPESSLVAHMAAEASMGLAIVIRDRGLDRLRVCSAIGCSRVFVDTSRNRSRRYCDPSTCGNRTNVAAYRARQRLGVPSGSMSQARS